MPPVQCPSCGRFLKNSFVASLAEATAPCPGCGLELRPDSFEGGGEPAAQQQVDATPSVRPPDLPPDEVRATDDDVLQGWDSAAGHEFEAWREDRPPFPTDTVVVASAGAAGLLLGLALGRDRRGTAAATGALAGVVAAAVARRLWRLET